MSSEGDPQLSWLAEGGSRFAFPPLSKALRDPNGLLAIGGDLHHERLLAAYRQGIFPWYNPDEEILWWSPDPRCVLFPDKFHCSRSLKKALRREDFAITVDKATARVIEQCSRPRPQQSGTWLSDEMRAAYIDLHHRGYCHSLEVWRDGKLVGGLYGVGIGKAFFGESMFSLVENASKIALYYLSEQMKQWGFLLLDCQVESPHIMSLGAELISRDAFSELLKTATADYVNPTPWQLSIAVPNSSIHLPK